jgi:hypothetical protein
LTGAFLFDLGAETAIKNIYLLYYLEYIKDITNVTSALQKKLCEHIAKTNDWRRFQLGLALTPCRGRGFF